MLGQFILEGSKPGSAAAAVHVTHQVLPPHREGMGRLLRESIRACERFWDTAGEAAARLSERVRVVVPFEPDSNLICIALNPAGNTSLAEDAAPAVPQSRLRWPYEYPRHDLAA